MPHRRNLVWAGGLVVVALLCTAAWAVFHAHSDTGSLQAAPSQADDEPPDAEVRVPVTVVHPRRDPGFVISVQELASVEAYFTADLYARVAGPVKYIYKDIGDQVAKGEVLAEIDVPDQVHEVAEKETVIHQRQKDLKLAEASVRLARAAVSQAQRNFDQKKEDLQQARSLLEYHEQRFKRFAKLLSQKAIAGVDVDAEERDFRAARAAAQGAQAGLKKAQAEWDEKRASLDAAEVDVHLQQAKVEVARKDRDRVRALADYAKLRSPFDGTINRRSIDPGDFVQPAATAHADPLLSIARSDIVTVVTKLPDNHAPFVGADTEVVIRMDELPGTEIRGRVTRFAPAIRNADRTLRVEVDLFNGPPREYEKFVLRSLGCFLAPFGDSNIANAAVLYSLSRDQWRHNIKGAAHSFPLLPQVAGGSLGGRRLMPGMSGTMRLQLQKFKSTYLVPSSAIFSRAGKTYLMEVQDEVAKLVPVRVQINDGNVAKVIVVARPANPKLGAKEVLRELTGDERIVTSRQSEIAAGDKVNASLQEWRPD